MATTSNLLVFFVISIPFPEQEFGNGGKSDFSHEARLNPQIGASIPKPIERDKMETKSLNL